MCAFLLSVFMVSHSLQISLKFFITSNEKHYSSDLYILCKKQIFFCSKYIDILPLSQKSSFNGFNTWKKASAMLANFAESDKHHNIWSLQRTIAGILQKWETVNAFSVQKQNGTVWSYLCTLVYHSLQTPFLYL